MNRRTAFALMVVAGLLLAACGAIPAASCANTTCPGQANPRTISVTGEGKVTVTPDIAVVSLGVESRDPDVTKAVDDNTAKTTAVIAAIRARQVKEEDIQTNNFSVYYQDTYDTMGQITGGRYVVSNNVSVTVRDISGLGKILGDALAAGANSVSGVSFSLDDPSTAMKEARAKAVADAKAKAEELAGGLGVTVGKVLTINEYGVTVPYAVDKMSISGLGGGGASVPISAGTSEIVMTISVVFEIE